jgi:predicted phage tail component-like protein
MIGAFEFNDIESSSFSLICKSVKRPLLPAAKVKRTELVGVSGVYDYPDNEYSLRNITMRITYLGTSFEELRSRAREIAAWLSIATWGKLIINDEPDKYYLAKVTDEIDLTSMYEAGEAEITFDCQPYAYSVEEVEEIFPSVVSGVPCVFDNLGTRVINFKSPQGSKSLITIVGTWTTLSLALNGHTLTFPTVSTSKTLIIDNIEMEVTLDTINVFDGLGGNIDEFLHILPGENSLAITGTGLTIGVTVNYIPLWM